jgi:hypothetical protein
LKIWPGSGKEVGSLCLGSQEGEEGVASWVRVNLDEAEIRQL